MLRYMRNPMMLRSTLGTDGRKCHFLSTQLCKSVIVLVAHVVLTIPRSFMRPNTPHWVLTQDPSILYRCYLYCSSLLRQSCYGVPFAAGRQSGCEYVASGLGGPSGQSRCLVQRHVVWCRSQLLYVHHYRLTKRYLSTSGRSCLPRGCSTANIPW